MNHKHKVGLSNLIVQDPCTDWSENTGFSQKCLLNFIQFVLLIQLKIIKRKLLMCSKWIFPLSFKHLPSKFDITIKVCTSTKFNRQIVSAQEFKEMNKYKKGSCFVQLGNVHTAQRSRIVRKKILDWKTHFNPMLPLIWPLLLLNY